MTEPKTLDLEQGTPEWFEARRGVITGTRAQQLLATTKAGKPTAAREDAICEMAMQLLSADFRTPATGHALRRGHEMEAEARDAYAFAELAEVQEVGFMVHGDYPMFGCSPDGLVGDNGGVEFKAPDAVKKHVRYLLDPSTLFDEYEFQVKQCLYISGREWWDIVSYDPCNTNGLVLAKYRLWAKDVDWRAYEVLLKNAYLEIEDMVTALKDVRDGAPSQKVAA